MLNLQPTLKGQAVCLRPLRKEDFETLYAAAADPQIWAQHPSPLRYQRPEFQAWFDEAIKSRGALVIEDLASGKVIGSSRYYDFDESQRSIAIGYTFLTCAHWGGITNAEVKRLMLDHAFQSLDTTWFHIAVTNIRSRKAIEKIGALLSHTAVRQLTGGPEEYCFYRIDAADPWRFQSHASKLQV